MKRALFAAGTLWALAVLPARREDLVTLAGTTYRDVQALRVEPDGVTWRHAEGMVKVDFADCPEPIRRAYHYDPAKAAAYRDTQARDREQAGDRARKLVQAHEEHQREQISMTLRNTVDAPLPSGAGTFSLRRDQESNLQAATAALGEQIDARKLARATLTRDDGTVWDRRLWAIPCALLGRKYSPGVAFDPHTDLNAHEFRANLHTKFEGPVPTSSLQDNFFQPIYATRSYYEGEERSEAFARGVPLKP